MDKDLAQPIRYYLEPGYIYCAKSRATVHTVVGSCVAVCLWDSQLSYGAMNHFVLPKVTDPKKATPRYGNVATAEVVNMMEKAGSKRTNLVAQILGGASPKPGQPESLGSRNVSIAREVLQRKGVRIDSEDTGGTMGRKVVFDTATGHLMVLKVHKIRAEDWVEEEG